MNGRLWQSARKVYKQFGTSDLDLPSTQKHGLEPKIKGHWFKLEVQVDNCFAPGSALALCLRSDSQVYLGIMIL